MRGKLEHRLSHIFSSLRSAPEDSEVGGKGFLNEAEGEGKRFFRAAAQDGGRLDGAGREGGGYYEHRSHDAARTGLLSGV